MRDESLFIVVPYVAVLSAVAGGLVCSVVRQGRPTRDAAAAIWRWAIGAVLAGHLFALVFPARVLLWNSQPLRLFVLEGTGVVAGCIALFGLIATVLQRREWADPGASSLIEAIATTLIAIEVVSGIAIAVLYRWASSWSAVTLTPYLLSLIRLEPAVTLVANMPFAVRLHVFAAFAVVAIAPFTCLARVVILPRDRRIQRAIGGVALVCTAGWRAFGTRCLQQAQSVSAMLVRNEEREN